jgi:hypothetical protein
MQRTQLTGRTSAIGALDVLAAARLLRRSSLLLRRLLTL